PILAIGLAAEIVEHGVGGIRAIRSELEDHAVIRVSAIRHRAGEISLAIHDEGRTHIGAVGARKTVGTDVVQHQELPLFDSSKITPLSVGPPAVVLPQRLPDESTSTSCWDNRPLRHLRHAPPRPPFPVLSGLAGTAPLP